MKDKLNQFNSLQADLENGGLEEVIRRREEINEQYKALNQMKEMAASYAGQIFPALQKMHKKRSNGLSSPTSLPLNLKRCGSLWPCIFIRISTSNAT